jgi:hypothetical protein
MRLGQLVFCLMLVGALLFAGGCSRGISSKKLKSMPVEIAMMCDSSGYGQATLLSSNQALVSAHQLQDETGTVQASGYIMIGEEVRRFELKDCDAKSDLSLITLSSSRSAKSEASIPFDNKRPIRNGERAYIVCYRPPDAELTSYQELYSERGALQVVSGTLEELPSLPSDLGSEMTFVPDKGKGYEWVKLAPGISGAPVFIEDPVLGAVIIGVNSSSIPVIERNQNGQRIESRVKLIAR